jgi:hypothetical protein
MLTMLVTFVPVVALAEVGACADAGLASIS